MKKSWVFQGGKLQQPVTSVTLVNTTSKTIDTEVPAGKRWLLQSIKATNPDDVARSIDFDKFKEAAATNKIKRYQRDSSVTAEIVQWPSNTNSKTEETVGGQMGEYLKAGNIIRVQWSDPGASSGGTDADGLVFEYLEWDV